MTTFQGPLAVVSSIGATNARATAARIGADGSAQFAGGAQIAGDVIVSGRMRNGPFGGYYGHQPLVQAVTVDMQAATAQTSIMSFPAHACVYRVSFQRLDDFFSTAASDITMKISGSAGAATSAFYNNATLGDGTNTQGNNSFIWPGSLANIGVTAAAPLADLVTSNSTWFVQTTAVSGAVTGKRGFLTVEYFRRN